MASSPSNNPTTYGSDTTAQANTTFVQADPSNFRTIVQKLTGAAAPPDDDQSSQKFPVTRHHHHHQNKPITTATAPKRPAFKLHERRQTTNNYNNLNLNLNSTNPTLTCNNNHNKNLISGGSFLFSPVSTLDFFPSHAMVVDSPRSPPEAEERAIAEKGFYLHPITSPLGPSGTPRGRGGGGAHNPPELLPLFPLRSPRDYGDDRRQEDCTASNPWNNGGGYN